MNEMQQIAIGKTLSVEFNKMFLYPTPKLCKNVIGILRDNNDKDAGSKIWAQIREYVSSHWFLDSNYIENKLAKIIRDRYEDYIVQLAKNPEMK